MGKQGKPPSLITDIELRGYIAASSLTPTQRGTLLMAADALYRHELRIIASFQRLADSMGVCRRSAIYRMQSLEKTGVLVKERGGGGRYENGKGRVNIWRLDVDALKKQAKNNASHLQTTEQDGLIMIEEKGATPCTDKGADKELQRCNESTATVQPVAHDPIFPISQEKKTNGNSQSGSNKINGSKPTRNLNDLRPWVNKYDAPKQSRANRMKQIRMQLEWDEKNQQRASRI